MEFTSLDAKLNFSDQRFHSLEGKKVENGKSFVESEMISKRTPKCARWELK
jgi:hypothetical protein